MDDLISRQEAIQAVGLTTWAGARISKLPSKQPEQKKGKWEMEWHCFLHREVPMCSQCLRVSAFKYNFCPYCGAEMREEKDNE